MIDTRLTMTKEELNSVPMTDYEMNRHGGYRDKISSMPILTLLKYKQKVNVIDPPPHRLWSEHEYLPKIAKLLKSEGK